MQMQANIQSASARLNLIAPSRYRRQDNTVSNAARTYCRLVHLLQIIYLWEILRHGTWHRRLVFGLDHRISSSIQKLNDGLFRVRQINPNVEEALEAEANQQDPESLLHCQLYTRSVARTTYEIADHQENELDRDRPPTKPS